MFDGLVRWLLVSYLVTYLRTYLLIYLLTYLLRLLEIFEYLFTLTQRQFVERVTFIIKSDSRFQNRAL
jgi:hypothetical protein